jgi:hypothetical protein
MYVQLAMPSNGPVFVGPEVVCPSSPIVDGRRKGLQGHLIRRGKQGRCFADAMYQYEGLDYTLD